MKAQTDEDPVQKLGFVWGFELGSWGGDVRICGSGSNVVGLRFRVRPFHACYLQQTSQNSCGETRLATSLQQGRQYLFCFWASHLGIAGFFQCGTFV